MEVLARPLYSGIALGLAGYAVVFRVANLASPRLQVVAPYYAKLQAGSRAEWCSSVASIVHATLVSAYAAHLLMFSGGHLKDRLYYDDQWQVPYTLSGLGPEVVQGIFLGYIAADLSTLLSNFKDITGAPAYVAHHIGFFAMVAVFSTLRTCQWYMFVGLCFEISSPFLNLRWLLKRCDAGDSNAYIANAIIGTTAYFCARVVPQPWLLYFVFSTDISNLRKVGGLGVAFLCAAFTLAQCFLQLFWFTSLVKGNMRLAADVWERKRKEI